MRSKRGQVDLKLRSRKGLRTRTKIRKNLKRNLKRNLRRKIEGGLEKVDQTIKKIIKRTLEKSENLYTKEAADLIYETGKAESGYIALEQSGGGPALGFFQCEPATLHDCIDNYIKYRPELQETLLSLGFLEDDPEFSLKTNIAVQVFFCRIKYRRDKEPIPKTKQDRAKYWKRVYNTEGGKGTVEHYLKANKW